MKNYWIVFLLFFTAPLSGQQLDDDWYEGTVVLKEGDTLNGQVNYIAENDIIRFKTEDDNKVKTFTPVKVTYVGFHDDGFLRYRELRVFNYRKVTDYEVPTFFETAVDGYYLDLLFREYRTQVTNFYYDPVTRMSRPITSSYIEKDFYLRKGEGTIVSFSGGRKELLRYLNEYTDAVKKFMKKNKLRPGKEEDLREIVLFFNNLKESNG